MEIVEPYRGPYCREDSLFRISHTQYNRDIQYRLRLFRAIARSAATRITFNIGNDYNNESSDISAMRVLLTSDLPRLAFRKVESYLDEYEVNITENHLAILTLFEEKQEAWRKLSYHTLSSRIFNFLRVYLIPWLNGESVVLIKLSAEPEVVEEK